MKASVEFGVFALAAVFAAGVWTYLSTTGALRPEPRVEILPKGGTNGTLRVATDSDFWPYSFVDADGRLSGREVEIAHAVANELGRKIELVPMSWEECVDAAVARRVDMVMTCSDISIGREMDALLMSTPFESDCFEVFGREKISSLDDLRGRRIGLMLDGNVNSVLFAAGFKPFVRQYPTYHEVLEAIRNGEVDFTVARHNSVVGWLRRTPVKGLRPLLTLGPSLCCIGVDSRRPELLREVNTAIALLRLRGEVARLNDKWLATYADPMDFAEVVSRHRAAFAAMALAVVLVLLWLATAAWTRHRLRVLALRMKNDRISGRLAAAERKARGAETPADVTASFDGIREPLLAYAERKNVAVSFECGSVTDRAVLADFDRCGPVFLSVGVEAVRRSAKGGRVVLRCEQVEKVKSRTAKGGRAAAPFAVYRYTVRDNGAGAETVAGTSLWKAVVEMMGGTVECRVKPSSGTTVIITLPFKVKT